MNSYRNLFICLFMVTSLLYGCKTNKNEVIPSFSWIKPGNTIDLSWTKNVGAHKFPGNRIVNANLFGAVNDSTILSTHAIQMAIDSCHNVGGGIVTFDPGHYTTGALFIKDGVNLQIGKDVTLYGSTNIDDYPEIPSRIAGIEMTWPSAVINFLNCENAALSGEGIIDCRGKVFWDKYWEMRKDYEQRGLRWIVDYDCKRVRGILASNSKNITLKDFTLMRTGFWGIQLLYSEYCTINGLTINNNIGGHGPSTDGIDIDSSVSILIENCDVDCNDDNICLKAGRDADGLRVNKPTENVVIRNCITRKGAGLITCGSETSGGIRNILGYNCKAIGTSTVLRFKSALNRGGVVENIYVSDIDATDVKDVIAADLNWNPKYSYSELPSEYENTELPHHWKVMLTPVEPEEKGYPSFRNVYFSNVNVSNAEQFIAASGWNEELKLENFNFFNITAQTKKAGRIIFTNQFDLKKINLTTANGDKILTRDNTNLITDINYHVQ